MDRRYKDKAPDTFTGAMKTVVFDLKRTHTDTEQELHEHAAVQPMGHGTAG